VTLDAFDRETSVDGPAVGAFTTTYQADGRPDRSPRPTATTRPSRTTASAGRRALDRLRVVDSGTSRIRFRYVGLTTSVAQVIDDTTGAVIRGGARRRLDPRSGAAPKQEASAHVCRTP
jgi:hypothetical protein